MRPRNLFPTALLLLSAGALNAQGPVWNPLVTGAPTGKPAELRFLQAASSSGRSTLELEVFGFWSETVKGADGIFYERLDFPGLGRLGEIGAPELPALRPSLAVATDASAIVLQSATVAAGDTHIFGMNVYPTPIPERDEDPGFGDTNGVDEVFVKDALIYGTNAFHPPTTASALAPIATRFGAIPAGRVELFPARFNPITMRLEVDRLTTYDFLHSGVLQTFAPLTKDKAAVGAAGMANWPTASNWIGTNTATYEARYLIVTPEEYLDELEPFELYRKSTGYQVTTITLESLPFVTCGEIRGAIDGWLQVGPAHFDHYCLLIGEPNVLPMCTSATPELVPSDDLYGSPSGLGDLDEEVFVGRLSVDDGAELTRQIQKIMAYELDFKPTHDYGDVLLVADEEDAPGKYVGAHEEVANATYAVPPSFQKIYGNALTATDAAVLDAVDENVGLVAYRGHGSSSRWSTWNLAGESFHMDEVDTLTNSQLPVVWAFTCTNNYITIDECIGEVWMETSRGAVAHYGSVLESGTSQNHTLDKKMFEAVFDLGLTTHGQAIAWAEDQMLANHPDDTWRNSWLYFLLGDPAMKIRRGKPNDFDLIAPSEVPAGMPFTIQVVDSTGNPLPDILVSVYKEPFLPGGNDELIFNAYTGTGGTVFVPGGLDLGAINTTGRDDDGNIAQEDIAVKNGAFVDIGDALAGTNGIDPVLYSASSLTPGTPVTVSVIQGLPNAPGLLAVGFVDGAIPLFGGIVHPVPAAFETPIFTDNTGRYDFDVLSWPAGVMVGLELFWQAGLLDPEAEQGISLTNALRSTQP